MHLLVFISHNEPEILRCSTSQHMETGFSPLRTWRRPHWQNWPVVNMKYTYHTLHSIQIIPQATTVPDSCRGNLLIHQLHSAFQFPNSIKEGKVLLTHSASQCLSVPDALNVTYIGQSASSLPLIRHTTDQITEWRVYVRTHTAHPADAQP